MNTWAAVMAGGAIGSLARHLVNIGATRVFGRPTPFAVAIVNVIGCAIIGWLAGAIAVHRLEMSATMRAFVFVGILGGFTTFSSFGLDILTLVREGARATAAINIAVQVGLGLAAVFAGYALASRVG
jgi:fluoride exporter